MQTKFFGDMPLFGEEALGRDPVVRPFMFLAFGLHLFWLYCVLFQLFPSAHIEDLAIQVLYRDTLVLMVLFAVATMLVMGWTISTISYWIRLRHVQIYVGIAMVAGTALLYLSQYMMFMPLVAIGGILVGASAGFLTLIWTEAFRRRETASLVINTMLAIIIFLICSACLVTFVPNSFYGLVYSLVPIFAFAGLFLTMHGKQAFFSQQEFTIDSDGIKMPVFGIREIPTFRRLRVRKQNFIVKMGIPSFLLGLAFGPLAQQATQLISFSEPVEIRLDEPLAFACLIALILTVLLVVLNQGQEHYSYYRFIVPPLLISIIATGALPDNNVHTMFALLNFIGVLFVIWVEFAELSHRYRISPILVSGFGLSFVVVGLLLGQSLLDVLNSSLQDSLDPLWVGVVLAVLLLVGYLLLPNEQAIKSMAIAGYNEHATTTDEQEASGKSKTNDNRGRFVARCERVSNTFLLTERETDLLYLLAKGRNATHIAKELYITEGTVKTHSWHIYKKLNVHTQQELIDLVDSQSFEKYE